MFLGALLDGLPEAFILGVGIALGGGVSVAFVVAVFVSNVPQGTAGTLALRQTGTSNRTIAMMWGWLTVASAAVAACGFLVADHIPDQGRYAQAFAGGAVLVMLADSMMPEAFDTAARPSA
jgi:ZIP family zinc transporter